MLYCLLLPDTRVVKYLYTQNKNIHTLKTIVIMVKIYSKIKNALMKVCYVILCYHMTKKLEAFTDFVNLIIYPSMEQSEKKQNEQPHFQLQIITSIAAAAGGSRRRLPKAGVERSSYVGIAYTISVKPSN